MGDVAVLTTNRDQAIRDAKDVLEEAMGKDFEAVAVVGIKQGRAHMCKSKSLDTLALVGALELAKHAILAHWQEK